MNLPNVVRNHVVCTAGHVDHGKSSLVQALTGVDPDRWEEEKRRGLTIDLGFAKTSFSDGSSVSFIDVPGHERFLKNMLSGVGSVDVCLFVVAATEGWKPQSEEHLRILELLGVKRGIVALTKVSIAEPDLCEIAILELQEIFEGTFLEEAPIVQVDSLSGEGITELSTELESLLSVTPVAKDWRRPRLWIDRAFSVKGSGTIATGTLTGGTIAVDDEVFISPGNYQTRVRALHTHNVDVPIAYPGSRVAVNLSGIERKSLSRGYVITKPDQWFLTSVIDADLQVLQNVSNEISRRGAYVVYIGTSEHYAKIRVLGSKPIAPGEIGNIRIFLNEKIPLVLGDRFILRESGRNQTVGGGQVLDPEPVLKASKASPDHSIERIIRERGWVTTSHLEALTGVKREDTVPGWIVHPPLLQKTIQILQNQINDAGPLGIEISGLNDHQRAVISLLEGVAIEGNFIRKEGSSDLSNHPFLDDLRSSLFKPPEPESIDRKELRELVRQGYVIEKSGIFFSKFAISEATQIISSLLNEKPEGVTVAEIRIALDTTRKYVLPILNHLDEIGVTLRRDNVRIAGKRLK